MTENSGTISNDATVDIINHPPHYSGHPSGVAPERIIGEMWCPHLATTFKYMTRYGDKHPDRPYEDVEKAAKYVEFEIARRARLGRFFTLPSARDLRYEERYAPFYLYIAAERQRDPYLADEMVKLWNLDKDSDPGNLQRLSELKAWLDAFARELRKLSDEGKKSRRAVMHRIKQRAGVIREWMSEGSEPEWNAWQVYLARMEAPGIEVDDQGWYDIEDFKDSKGGKTTLYLVEAPVDHITVSTRTWVDLRRVEVVDENAAPVADDNEGEN